MIRMLEYSGASLKCVGEINPDANNLADELVTFIIQNGIHIKAHEREKLLIEVDSHIKDRNIDITTACFINTRKHPLSLGSYEDFTYAIEHNKEMLFLRGPTDHMDMETANRVLKFIYGDVEFKPGEFRQKFILTRLKPI